jgi:hypothetical protein
MSLFIYAFTISYMFWEVANMAISKQPGHLNTLSGYRCWYHSVWLLYHLLPIKVVLVPRYKIQVLYTSDHVFIMYHPIWSLISRKLTYLGLLSCENPDRHMRTLMANLDDFPSLETTQLHQNSQERESIHGFEVSKCALSCCSHALKWPVAASGERSLWLFDNVESVWDWV